MIALSLASAAMRFATSWSSDRSPPPRVRPRSFSLLDWRGWKAPDDHTLLLRMSSYDIYRIDLTQGTSLLQAPGARLVSVVQDGERGRRPLDLDLRISDATGAAVSIQAKSIRRLSRSEADALPHCDRP